MSNYPKEREDGTPYWACCVSIINAGNCNHERVRKGLPLLGEEGENNMGTCMGCLKDFDNEDLVWQGGLLCESCKVE